MPAALRPSQGLNHWTSREVPKDDNDHMVEWKQSSFQIVELMKDGWTFVFVVHCSS